MIDGGNPVLAERKRAAYGEAMCPNVLIRDVPADTHEVLVTRAQEAGLSLQEYLLRHVQDFAGRPTMAELMDSAAARVEALGVGESDIDEVVGWIHQAREERDPRV